MVANDGYHDQGTHTKPELDGNTSTMQSFVPAPSPALYQYPSPTHQEASELAPYPYITHQDANDLAGTQHSPMVPASTAIELSSPDHGIYAQELSSDNQWPQSHELSTTAASRAQSVYSDNHTLVNDQGEGTERIQELRARQSALKQERERLHRMEMLREEEDRLEREIELIEQSRKR
jgi:hypothetical protein